MKNLLLAITILSAGAIGHAQTPQVPGPVTTDLIAQPATWVPFTAVVERDGVPIGRFARDARGSTRLDLHVPDAEGRTIVIENIPEAKYYVFRPLTGWTVQPMRLPTAGWTPLPVARVEAGTAVSEDGVAAYERVNGHARERRAPSLNFFAVYKQRLDTGAVDRHRQIVVGEVPASLFAPPPGAAVTARDQPGGIVARPAPRAGGQ